MCLYAPSLRANDHHWPEKSKTTPANGVKKSGHFGKVPDFKGFSACMRFHVIVSNRLTRFPPSEANRYKHTLSPACTQNAAGCIIVGCISANDGEPGHKKSASSQRRDAFYSTHHFCFSVLCGRHVRPVFKCLCKRRLLAVAGQTRCFFHAHLWIGDIGQCIIYLRFSILSRIAFAFSGSAFSGSIERTNNAFAPV